MLPSTAKALAGISFCLISTATLAVRPIRFVRLAVTYDDSLALFYGQNLNAVIENALREVNATYMRDCQVQLHPKSSPLAMIPLSPADENSANSAFTSGGTSALFNITQALVDNTFGAGTYDVGIYLTAKNLGVNGQAILGGAYGASRGQCIATAYGNGATIHQTIAHELGHLFGAEHTFATFDPVFLSQRANNSAVEPGNGKSLMSYGHSLAGAWGESTPNGREMIFHPVSVDAIKAKIDAHAVIGSTWFDIDNPLYNLRRSSAATPNVVASAGVAPKGTPLILGASVQWDAADDYLYTQYSLSDLRWYQKDVGPQGQGAPPRLVQFPNYITSPLALSKPGTVFPLDQFPFPYNLPLDYSFYYPSIAEAAKLPNVSGDEFQQLSNVARTMDFSYVAVSTNDGSASGSGNLAYLYPPAFTSSPIKTSLLNGSEITLGYPDTARANQLFTITSVGPFQPMIDGQSGNSVERLPPTSMNVSWNAASAGSASDSIDFYLLRPNSSGEFATAPTTSHRIAAGVPNNGAHLVSLPYEVNNLVVDGRLWAQPVGKHFYNIYKGRFTTAPVSADAVFVPAVAKHGDTCIMYVCYKTRTGYSNYDRQYQWDGASFVGAVVNKTYGADAMDFGGVWSVGAPQFQANYPIVGYAKEANGTVTNVQGFTASLKVVPSSTTIQKISGVVSLEGFHVPDGARFSPLQFWSRPAGSSNALTSLGVTVLETPSYVNGDCVGDFTLALSTQLAAGNYELYCGPAFNRGRWLRRGTTISVGSGGANVTGAQFSLPNGDIVPDGSVDIADYTKLALFFDSVLAGAQMEWFENADVSGDGQVDINDYSIFAGSMDLNSEP